MKIIRGTELVNYPYKSLDPNQPLENVLQYSDEVEVSEGEKHLKSIYSERYIQKIKKTCELKQVIAELPGSGDLYKCAVNSASVAIKAAINQDFALTRPAGHHADADNPMGFCLFNNVAVAIQYLLDNDLAKKVCVIDFDGHHGNGTEKIFSKNDNVLMLSLAQIGAFPSDNNNQAVKEKRSSNMSIKIELPQRSDDEMLLKSIKQYESLIKSFGPDYIAISAGFDGYKDDSLLNLSFTDIGYLNLGKYIKSLGAKSFGVLEGGYHPDLEKCILAFVNGYNS